jgi:hypothetical protein
VKDQLAFFNLWREDHERETPWLERVGGIRRIRAPKEDIPAPEWFRPDAAHPAAMLREALIAELNWTRVGPLRASLSAIRHIDEMPMNPPAPSRLKLSEVPLGFTFINPGFSPVKLTASEVRLKVAGRELASSIRPELPTLAPRSVRLYHGQLEEDLEFGTRENFDLSFQLQVDQETVPLSVRGGVFITS